MNTKEIGDKGERMAIDILEAKGYEIIEKNYRFKRSEIDLICLHENLLVFVEVKALNNYAFQYPEQKVDQRKIEKVIEGAEAYIYAINWQKDIRFDIISINLQDNSKHLHIEDAFY